MLAVNLDNLQHIALILHTVFLHVLPMHKIERYMYLVICIYHSDSPSYSEIHEILSRFMDYPHNSDEIRALELLTTVLKHIPSDKQTAKTST